ncbi:hypothetical protein [Planktomarina sp.]|uniref:hypothetical protein n=1 Tax=Planktomarina sp. TaxID=2024851 RepID=UPI0032615713
MPRREQTRKAKALSQNLKAPSYRVLLVMDTIGAQGPISLNALCALLPDISRAGIWRAAATLRDYGWVRTRLADNAFELTSKMDFRLANAHFAHTATEGAVEEINRRLEKGGSDVTACMFVAPGRLEIIETTQADVQIGVPLSLVFDELALAAQSKMDRALLLKHLTAYINRDDLPAEEARIIQMGEHIRALQALRDANSQAGEWVVEREGEVFFRSAFRQAK